MKKQIISMVLILAMVISLFSSTLIEASAESTSQPIISVEDAWAAAGSTVEVNVVISENPGILGATLTLSWAEGLTLLDAENGDAFVNLSYQGSNNYKPAGTNFVWYGNKLNAVKDGNVLKLTFQVDADADVASKLAVNITGKDIIDVDKNPVSAIFASGGIRIVDYTPGDVDGNKEVDTPDLIMLAKYIVDDCTTDPNGYNVSPNLNASDVNDDGDYTALDLVLISQYIVDGCKTDPDGYNVVLKPVTPKCSHSNMEGVDYKKATCTEDGHISYYHCADCESYFNDSEATLELFWEQIVLTSPGHNKVIDEAVPPSYDEPGLTEGSHCSVCNEVFVPQQEVPMLQANYHSITYNNLNGAESPELTQYAEHIGVSTTDMPVPEAPGYVFKGWYTASEGGTVVDYIPAGSTQDYVLFARWDLVTYTINYFEAPNYEGATTYTVEDEIYLSDPNWPGLGFTGWTEAKDKIQTEDRGGKTYYKIAAGTTGNMELTANWKLMRNIATPGNNTLMLAQYSPETGRYYFTYELGTIENVVLEQMSSGLLYNHTGAGDFTLEMSSENTMEESFADSISQTISKSISSSSEWEESKDWAKEISNEHSTHVDIGVEFGNDDSFVKASIETGYGYANTNTDSWGGSESKGGSYGEETENGQEVGSSFSYLKSMTTSSSTSVTITADAPKGYYDYVQAGNIRVFGIVTYDSNDGNIYMNTYSMLDNMHGVVLYYPTASDLNNPTCETLQYSIPRDNIAEKIANSYFVEYVAEGGNGKMNKTLHTIGGVEKLAKNEFTREGYLFMGWETRGKVEGQDEPVSTGTYTDEQIINTPLASNGQVVTMYALWEKIDYTIEYAAVKPSTASTQLDRLPSPTGCKYDEDVTLAAAPVLPGYTFGGWYYDSACTQKAGDAGQTLTKPNLVKENEGSIKLYPKWTANTYTITFNTDGGTISQSTMTVVFDKAYNCTLKPSKTDNVFQNWVMPDGSTFADTGYWQIAENVTVTAKWLKVRYVWDNGLSRDNFKRIYDDTTDYIYLVDPEFDLEALKKAGYTKIKYYIWYECYEEDTGYQDTWIRPYYSKSEQIDHYQQEADNKEWEEFFFTIATLNLTDGRISSSGAVYIQWGAHGKSGDDLWRIGKATVTITAEKG